MKISAKGLKIALFQIQKDAFKGLEGQTSARVFRRLASEGDEGSLDLYEVPADNMLEVCSVCDHQRYDILIFICGNVFIARQSIHLLAEIATQRDDLSAIVPVTNRSHVPYQIQPPSFSYSTLSLFREAVREIQDQYEQSVIEVENIDDFCLAIRTEVIADLVKDTPLTRLPATIREAGLTYGVARGVYVHCYGDLYESGRDDLIAHVSLNAREILDVGCANGLLGEILKKRQGCTVTGVESDLDLVSVARGRLDSIIVGDIEKIIDKGTLGRFDCIVCGDVLEHLDNPWKVVSGLRRHLKMGGIFIASVPNVANWAIVHDMLKGRWDYVPFTILSGTHIRFFTRETLRECFEDAGYRVTDLYFQSFGLPPGGAAFIDNLKMGLADVDEKALQASEIVIVAARD